MKTKVLALSLALIMVFSLGTPSVLAIGAKEAASSLFLPTTGQAMNGQIASRKTKIMAGIEVAAIATVAILGGVVGGPVVWAGLGPLIANHIWSATDAYKSAQVKEDPNLKYQMSEAQRTLEVSRQRRFDREEIQRSDVRDRIEAAGAKAA